MWAICTHRITTLTAVAKADRISFEKNLPQEFSGYGPEMSRRAPSSVFELAKINCASVAGCKWGLTSTDL